MKLIYVVGCFFYQMRLEGSLQLYPDLQRYIESYFGPPEIESINNTTSLFNNEQLIYPRSTFVEWKMFNTVKGSVILPSFYLTKKKIFSNKGLVISLEIIANQYTEIIDKQRCFSGSCFGESLLFDGNKQFFVLFCSYFAQGILNQYIILKQAILRDNFQDDIKKNFKTLIVKSPHDKKFLSIPVSICYHINHNIQTEPVEFSIMEEKAMFLFQADSNLSKLKRIPVDLSRSISAIVKHESIGRDTFIILAEDILYFGLLDRINNTINLAKQHFPEKIVTFAVNQDHDTRTTVGRARFFMVLFEAYKNNNTCFQKLMLVDLWQKATNGKIPGPVYTVLSDTTPYNTMSFSKSDIFLWAGHYTNPEPKKIELHDLIALRNYKIFSSV